MNCSYPPHFTMDRELKESRAEVVKLKERMSRKILMMDDELVLREAEVETLREKLKAREATEEYNPMRAMLMRLLYGSIINDLKDGKIEKVIGDMEIGVARLDALEDEHK